MTILQTTTIAFTITLMLSAYQTAGAINLNQTIPHQNNTQLMDARGGGGHAGFSGGSGLSRQGIGTGEHVEPSDVGNIGRDTGAAGSKVEESNVTHRDITNFNPNRWNEWQGWGAWSLGGGDDGGCTTDANGNVICGDTDIND